MTYSDLVNVFEYSKAMQTFDPLTGKDEDPAFFNEDNKQLYFATCAAIKVFRFLQERSFPDFPSLDDLLK